jgi:hypothetical protein
MASQNLIPFPLRDPQSFTPEINRQVLETSAFRRLLFAATEALPHVDDPSCGEELRQALCQLIAPGWQRQ